MSWLRPPPGITSPIQGSSTSFVVAAHHLFVTSLEDAHSMRQVGLTHISENWYFAWYFAIGGEQLGRSLGRNPLRTQRRARRNKGHVQRLQWAGQPVSSDARELANERPSPQRSFFVGRESEVRQLQSAFEAAATGGDGALVLLVGEPGIGKTALCHQVARFVVGAGGRTLFGHCYE